MDHILDGVTGSGERYHALGKTKIILDDKPVAEFRGIAVAAQSSALDDQGTGAQHAVIGQHQGSGLQNDVPAVFRVTLLPDFQNAGFPCNHQVSVPLQGAE